MDNQIENRFKKLEDKVQNFKPKFPFMALLTLMFVGAKLLGYIDWSWWWVFSPLWIEAAVVLTLMTLFGIGTYVFYRLFK